jgi:hypothetical protein
VLGRCQRSGPLARRLPRWCEGGKDRTLRGRRSPPCVQPPDVERSGIAAQRSKLPSVPCVIVFGGNDQEPLTLELDVDAEDVAKSLRGHSLQRIAVKERVLWVNPQNVLYVEDASIPSPAE